MQLYEQVERHDLKYPPYKPRILDQFRNAEVAEDIFAAIRQENLLIHHPYDSFAAVIEFLNAAARDRRCWPSNRRCTVWTQLAGRGRPTDRLRTRQTGGGAGGA